MTPLLVGAVLAFGTALFAALTGFDRSRAFYPTVLIVVASYYELFAVMGGSSAALGIETLAFALFIVVAVVGFASSLWIVAGGLLAHGLFDALRGPLIDNPGIPDWWPAFCLSFDLVAAACLGGLLLSRRIAARSRKG